ncbi:MAG: glycosyltransferase [Planctomycetia bacterium]|nr:glycosyltransferase [Planctomycetia bacterium]
MASPTELDVLLIPLGSAGDVHPFIGLALTLRNRGHKVTVATNPHFAPLAQRLGLEFEPVGTLDEYDIVTRNPDLWHPTRGFKMVVRYAMLGTMRQLYELVRRRYVPGRSVVVTQATALGARIARDKLGVPLVTVHLQPAVVRSVYESPLLPPLLLGPKVPRWFKRFQFYLTDRLLIDPLLGPEVNAFRAELGLPPVRRLLGPWWNSPDRVIGLFPDWYARLQPDWPQKSVLTNFPLWDETESRETPPGLEQFLAAGEPPVVFTPGSAMRVGADFFAAAVEACQILKRRGLLLSQFRDHLPAQLPATVAHFDYVPFSQVLPRAAAIVHHGGIGTVAQSFAAGVPQIIMPMAHDQPDNAARVERLGVGRSLPPKNFRGPQLAAELEQLLSPPQVRERCRELATRLKGCNGLELAADEVEATVNR